EGRLSTALLLRVAGSVPGGLRKTARNGWPTIGHLKSGHCLSDSNGASPGYPANFAKLASVPVFRDERQYRSHPTPAMRENTSARAHRQAAPPGLRMLGARYL